MTGGAFDKSNVQTAQPSAANRYFDRHGARLLASLRHWTGRISSNRAWNLFDESGAADGQGATSNEWRYP